MAKHDDNVHQRKPMNLRWWKVLICIATLNVLSVSLKGEFKSSGTFENICQGCKIIHLISVAKKVASLFQCIHKCKRSSNCKSINYKHSFEHYERKVDADDHNCELIGATMKTGGKKVFVELWGYHEPISFVST